MPPAPVPSAPVLLAPIPPTPVASPVPIVVVASVDGPEPLAPPEELLAAPPSVVVAIAAVVATAAVVVAVVVTVVVAVLALFVVPSAVVALPAEVELVWGAADVEEPELLPLTVAGLVVSLPAAGSSPPQAAKRVIEVSE